MNKGILSELRKIRAKSINDITGTERIVTIHGFIIILIHSFFAIKYEMIMARTKAETSPAAILKHVYPSLSNRLQLSIFVSRQKKNVWFCHVL